MTDLPPGAQPEDTTADDHKVQPTGNGWQPDDPTEQPPQDAGWLPDGTDSEVHG